ncbi:MULTISPECIES: MarR family winged helix-turn-helix transcriptional regulator [unclassified Nocardioides]|uniref:MarR family winged helix-turn-helix transcriptional regulator n=1 Tax=unclassified Nocardioides TaxID=2615069 RepID=UPI003621C158
MAGKVGSKRSQASLLHDLADELLRFSKRRHANVEGTELDTSAFKLLWVLSDERPRTLRELAEELDLELSTINRQVNAAVRAGFLERFSVPDGPSKPVRPTAEGRRLYEHDSAVHADLLRSVLAEMGADPARELIHGLRAFNDAYERRTPRRRRD